jgi:lipoate-protein ligase A
MIAAARKKVKEGKLVKVDVEFDEFIRKIKITGDFFLHPEDVIEKIEKSLTGMKKDASEEIIISKIQAIVEENDAQMIGIGSESLAEVIREALA